MLLALSTAIPLELFNFNLSAGIVQTVSPLSLYAVIKPSLEDG